VRHFGGSERALVKCGEEFGVRARFGGRRSARCESAGEEAFERLLLAGVALPIAIA
jgi:hypothetical protein